MKASIDDLNDNVLVGDTNDETVFRGIARQMLVSFWVPTKKDYILFVLGLCHEAFPGIICTWMSRHSKDCH